MLIITNNLGKYKIMVSILKIYYGIALLKYLLNLFNMLL